MKKWVLLLILIAIFCFGKSAETATTINFDDVKSWAIIDDQYSHLGVIFSTSGKPDYSDGHAYARESTLSISGPNVIGGKKSGYPFLNDANIIGIAEFVNPANKVEVWAKPFSDEYLSAWMKVYNYNSGSLLTTIGVSGSAKGEAGLLTITWPSWNIGKVEFSGAGKRVGFDNFSFNVVPEPISSILFVTGGATLAVRGYWKKRKRKI